MQAGGTAAAAVLPQTKALCQTGGEMVGNSGTCYSEEGEMCACQRQQARAVAVNPRLLPESMTRNGSSSDLKALRCKVTFQPT